MKRTNMYKNTEYNIFENMHWFSFQKNFDQWSGWQIIWITQY